MAGPILQALQQGFTAKSILKALAKKSPKVGKYVALATAAGFSPHVTLKKLVQPNKSAANSDDFLTQNERTRKSQKDNRRKELMEAVGVLGTAGAAAAGLYSMLGKESPIEAWKKGVLESSSSTPPSSDGSNPLTIDVTPGNPPSSPSSQRSPEREALLKKFEAMPEEKAALPIVGEGVKPLQIDTPIVQVPRVETQFPHLKKFVDKHFEAGKSPEEIFGNIQKSGLKGIADKYTEHTGRSYLERIKELSGGKGAGAAEVITPFGAGTIHNEKGNDAFVKIDNKLHKIPKSEIEEPPQSAVEAVTNYLNIPEKDRSSNVALFAWNPDEKRAYFQFHNEDSFYEYTDVDPAVVDAIAEKRAIPKTEGGNEYGVWSPDDQESIGAALWKYIISTPKYAKNKKGDPVNPYYKKLPIKYDYWEKLRKASKRKKG